MAKRKHNFLIADEVWKKFKMHCLEKDKTATAVIESFILKTVQKNDRKKKVVK